MKKRIKFNEILEAEEQKDLEQPKVTESEQDQNKGKGKDADVKQDEIKRPSDDTFVSKEVQKAEQVKTKDFDMKQVETEPHSNNETKESKVKEDTEINVQPDGHVEIEVKQEDTSDKEEPICAEIPEVTEDSDPERQKLIEEVKSKNPNMTDDELQQMTDEELKKMNTEQIEEACPECGAPDGEGNCEHQPLTKEVLEGCKITEDLDLSEATSTSKTITVNLNGNTYAYEANSVDEAKDIVQRFNKLRTFSKGRAINWLKGQVDMVGKVPIEKKAEPVEESVDSSLYEIYEMLKEQGVEIESDKNVNGVCNIVAKNPSAKALLAIANALVKTGTESTGIQLEVKAPQVIDSEQITEDNTTSTPEVEEIPKNSEDPTKEGEEPDAPIDEPAGETEPSEPVEEPDEVTDAISAILSADADKIEVIQNVIDQIKSKDETVSLYRIEAEEQEPKVILAQVDNAETKIIEINEEGELQTNDIPTQFADIETVSPDVVKKFLAQE